MADRSHVFHPKIWTHRMWWPRLHISNHITFRCSVFCNSYNFHSWLWNSTEILSHISLNHFSIMQRFTGNLFIAAIFFSLGVIIFCCLIIYFISNSMRLYMTCNTYMAPQRNFDSSLCCIPSERWSTLWLWRYTEIPTKTQRKKRGWTDVNLFKQQPKSAKLGSCFILQKKKKKKKIVWSHWFIFILQIQNFYSKEKQNSTRPRQS